MTELEFITLTKKWRQDTCFLSSSTQIMKHPAVQELVAAGDATVPWIIEQYREDISLSWSDLLHQITGVLPFGRKDQGYTKKIQQAWMGWWEKNAWNYKN